MARKAPKATVRISSSQNSLRVPRKKLSELIAFVARQEGTGFAELDLAVVGSKEMASLNRRYLGRAVTTDVLSFDLSDPAEGGICAQLVVCADQALQRARARGLRPQRELMLYVVHGLLHLMDYNHNTPSAAACMHAREDEILDTFFKRRRKQ